VSTNVWQVGNCLEACVFYVQYLTPGPVPLLVPSSSGLSGGKIGTSPKVTASVYRPGSKNIFLDPIPGEILFTAHDTPQIQVVANNVYSTCVDSTCNIIVSDANTPVLASYTFSTESGALSLTITDPRTTKFS
jgi:hypothetical protein